VTANPIRLNMKSRILRSLIDEVGGLAYLYGVSSGGCLTLEAAIKLRDKIKKLSIYEAPYKSQENLPDEWLQYRTQLKRLLEENRRGDAVALFMAFVGTHVDQIEGMRKTPMWSMLEAEAPHYCMTLLQWVIRIAQYQLNAYHT